MTTPEMIWGEEFAAEVTNEAMYHNPDPGSVLLLAIAIKKVLEQNKELKKQIEELKNGK